MGSAPKHRVFFIVGRGRSGTTLLSRMLARHPALDVAPEGFFVLSLRRRYGAGAPVSERVEDFCQDLVGENRMRTWGLDLDDVARRIVAEPGLGYARACELVYASYAQHTRGRAAVEQVGDKNPTYALFTRELLEVFPDARFIHMVRDPRDNVLSFRTVPFDLQDVAALAYRWRRYNEAVLEVAEQHPAHFTRLRFEDLIAEPEPALRGVCAALGVEYDPAMLDFQHERPDGFYGEGSHWFDKLGQPLDAGQSQKWRSALSVRDVATIEGLCAPLMRRFDYPESIPAPDASLLPARARLGALVGRASVRAERVLFGTVPAEARAWFINTYRARTGRT